MSQEDLKDLWNIFHDGSLDAGHWRGADLHLEIGIEYLAEQIGPDHRKIRVVLEHAQFVFDPWWLENQEGPEQTDVAQICGHQLEILSAEIVEDRVHVACQYDGPKSDGFAGGNLIMGCAKIQVLSEGGEVLGLSKLREIAQAYWDNFGE